MFAAIDSADAAPASLRIMLRIEILQHFKGWTRSVAVLQPVSVQSRGRYKSCKFFLRNLRLRWLTRDAHRLAIH